MRKAEGREKGEGKGDAGEGKRFYFVLSRIPTTIVSDSLSKQAFSPLRGQD